MSCWVVPTVAADFWGVTLDVVWRRISEGLVPHKTERGFVFIDLDPWTADDEGNPFHIPPSTFVAAGQEVSSVEAALADPFAPDEEEVAQWKQPQTFEDEGVTVLEAELLTSDPWDFESDDEPGSVDEPEPILVGIGADDEEFEDADNDHDADNELPDLDEEETATFGRLSWVDVRAQVSRTRRPPPSRNS